MPLEVDRQADGNLVTGEAEVAPSEEPKLNIIDRNLHVLRWHFLLVLSQCVHSSEGNVRIGDVVLTGREQLQVVTLLKDGTVVGGDIEAGDLVRFQNTESIANETLTISKQCKPSPCPRQ